MIDHLQPLIHRERRLSTALALRDEERWEADAPDLVIGAARDLIGALSGLVRDDEFWERLGGLAGELGPEDVDALNALDASGLAALLVAAGYRNPPPPPVGELVDETVAAAAWAMQVGTRGDDATAAVIAARSALGTLVLRCRRQIAPSPIPPPEPVVRSVARTAARLAQQWIPIVVGVAVGAGVELHAPGTGLGFVVGKVASELVDRGIQIAIRAAIGHGVSGEVDAPVADARRTQPVVRSPYVRSIRAWPELKHRTEQLDSALDAEPTAPGAVREAVDDLVSFIDEYGLPVDPWRLRQLASGGSTDREEWSFAILDLLRQVRALVRRE